MDTVDIIAAKTTLQNELLQVRLKLNLIVFPFDLLLHACLLTSLVIPCPDGLRGRCREVLSEKKHSI